MILDEGEKRMNSDTGSNHGGRSWEGLKESLRGPDEGHPNRQEQPETPLYLRLQKKLEDEDMTSIIDQF